MEASLTPFSTKCILNASEEEAHGWLSKMPTTSVTRANCQKVGLNCNRQELMFYTLAC